MERLSNQDKIFVKEIIETGNQTLSAKKAYGIKKNDYAGKKGSVKVREGKIVKAIQSLADRIPDDKLHNVMMEGLDATYKEEPDFGVRHKYLDTALKIKGVYGDDESKNINILMPVLVKFLNKDDDTTNSNGNTN